MCPLSLVSFHPRAQTKLTRPPSQHFQGLRRAQNKADSSGLAPSTISSSARNNDPSQNPITRRPGPGRGRPRKNPVANPANPANPPNPANPAAPAPLAPMGMGAAPVAPMGTGAPAPLPGMAPSNAPAPAHVAGMPNIPVPHHGDASSMTDAQSIQDADGESPQPRMTGDGSLSVSGHGNTPLGDDLGAVDPSLEDPDEHMAKRPRLHENQDPSLEDVAVMNALSAHNNPGGGMGFHPDYAAQAWGSGP